MIDWLRQALGLPEGFSGVIQDSASSATLAAVLTMRERALDWAGNKHGLAGQKATRIYCSAEVHTSIDRAIWVAGIGEDNLVKLSGKGRLHGIDAAELDAAIVGDKAAGRLPAGIIASVGGTSIGGTDDVAALCAVARRHGLYVHVDAAWAGSAMICPEFRHYWAGVEQADSVVFNPHKWLGAQFDCSIHFVREPESLVKTLAIRPEFLKTHGRDGIVNYSEWTVPLGRRFRALKLWFLLRAHGLEGLRSDDPQPRRVERKAGRAGCARCRISRSSPSRCCRCFHSVIMRRWATTPTRIIWRWSMRSTTTAASI